MTRSSTHIPQVWDEARDEAFFRLTALLFDPSFSYGAGVLLASYDPEDDAAPVAVAQSSARPSSTGPIDDAYAAVPVQPARDSSR
jgi:hypothetical protein